MIPLILLTICIFSDQKSLLNSPSLSSGAVDDKAVPSDSLKRPDLAGFQDLSLLPPQPRTSFHIDFTQQNGTEIVANRPTIFEVIPADHICDFCTAVIKKLKERQLAEPDFESNMREECWKHNGTECDDGNVCELINKVALERLRKMNQ
ncbi:hypothetical protein COOONC_23625 [Cooperia oncophora]